MRSFFPAVFSQLLPLILPEALTVMLVRVAEGLSMPDYMRAQTSGLMPYVIDDSVPLVTDLLSPTIARPTLRSCRPMLVSLRGSLSQRCTTSENPYVCRSRKG